MCDSCEGTYHPACILKVGGLYVDKNGKNCCCQELVKKVCECEEKEKQIQALKQRLRDLNSSIYHERTADQDSILDQEIVDVNSQDVLSCREVGVDHHFTITKRFDLMEKQLAGMELSLTLAALNPYLTKHKIYARFQIQHHRK